MKPIISTLALVLPLFGCNPAPREAGTTLVREFIRNSWDAVVRFNPNDSLTLIGLPYPYTVPCVAGTFQELYYWDTYFTCEGLAADGRTELAKTMSTTCFISSIGSDTCPTAAVHGISIVRNPLSGYGRRSYIPGDRRQGMARPRTRDPRTGICLLDDGAHDTHRAEPLFLFGR